MTQWQDEERRLADRREQLDTDERGQRNVQTRLLNTYERDRLTDAYCVHSAGSRLRTQRQPPQARVRQRRRTSCWRSRKCWARARRLPGRRNVRLPIVDTAESIADVDTDSTDEAYCSACLPLPLAHCAAAGRRLQCRPQLADPLEMLGLTPRPESASARDAALLQALTERLAALRRNPANPCEAAARRTPTSMPSIDTQQPVRTTSDGAIDAARARACRHARLGGRDRLAIDDDDGEGPAHRVAAVVAGALGSARDSHRDARRPGIGVVRRRTCGYACSDRTRTAAIARNVRRARHVARRRRVSSASRRDSKCRRSRTTALAAAMAPQRRNRQRVSTGQGRAARRVRVGSSGERLAVSG